MAGTFQDKRIAQEVRRMKQRGFIHDFEIKSKDILEIKGMDQGYLPTEVKVEYLTTPNIINGILKENTIYGIKTSNGVKGVLVCHKDGSEAGRISSFIAKVKINYPKKTQHKTNKDGTSKK